MMEPGVKQSKLGTEKKRRPNNDQVNDRWPFLEERRETRIDARGVGQRKRKTKKFARPNDTRKYTKEGRANSLNAAQNRKKAKTEKRRRKYNPVPTGGIPGRNRGRSACWSTGRCCW